MADDIQEPRRSANFAQTPANAVRVDPAEGGLWHQLPTGAEATSACKRQASDHMMKAASQNNKTTNRPQEMAMSPG